MADAILFLSALAERLKRNGMVQQSHYSAAMAHPLLIKFVNALSVIDTLMKNEMFEN